MSGAFRTGAGSISYATGLASHLQRPRSWASGQDLRARERHWAGPRGGPVSAAAGEPPSPPAELPPVPWATPPPPGREEPLTAPALPAPALPQPCRSPARALPAPVLPASTLPAPALPVRRPKPRGAPAGWRAAPPLFRVRDWRWCSVSSTSQVRPRGLK